MCDDRRLDGDWRKMGLDGDWEGVGGGIGGYFLSFVIYCGGIMGLVQELQEIRGLGR